MKISSLFRKAGNLFVLFAYGVGVAHIAWFAAKVILQHKVPLDTVLSMWV